MLAATPSWSSPERDETLHLAWGDVDGDGDLDLAVGNISDIRNISQPNRLYRNDGATSGCESVNLTLAWSSFEEDDTLSVAWGDYDNDGDLDLGTGNGLGNPNPPQPNRLYQNINGHLTAVASWSSNEVEITPAIAWGDVDGDGDLDLAAGNFNQRNRLYRNESHDSVAFTPIWLSDQASATQDLAWGDIDGNGNLDLITGNGAFLATGYRVNQSDVLYHNDAGALPTTPTWASVANLTNSLAWGDVDGDGDLDLAVGGAGINHVYQNMRRTPVASMNNPPYLTIDRPGITNNAPFFSTSHIIQSATIPIAYTLFDAEGDIVPKIFPEYSPNGGGQWFPATSGSGGDGLTHLAASPAGTPHTFVWQAEADLIKSDAVVFRIRVQPNYTHSPILWPAQDGKSPLFRVEAPWYIKVIDPEGNPVVGTTIYANGQAITQTVTGAATTNRAGLLNPGQLPSGTTLVALTQQAEIPTARTAHDGWAYRTYLTNVEIDQTGQTDPFTVSGAMGPQVLTIQPENALVVFNLLVSVEWDAEDAYLQDIALAMERAADFLYDATDGQMTFGQVTITDNATHWTEADLQISAKNIFRPYAYINGIRSNDKSHLIRVGRYWDGDNSDQGDWSEANGFRTLVHEFGHYGLGLYDEYFGYEDYGSDGLGSQVDTHCIEPENRDIANDVSNASIMDYHYTSSELADLSRWTAWCQDTAQHQLNNGEADWQTLLRLYSDPSGLERWRLISPDERAGAGQAVAGPEIVSLALPFPVIQVVNEGFDPQVAVLQVCHQGHPYQAGVWTTLHTGGKIIDQGLTDEAGSLDILGARPGDKIQMITLDGIHSAEVLLPLDGPLELSAASQRSLSDLIPDPTTLSVPDILALGNKTLTTISGHAQPYLRLWPSASGDQLDGLRLTVTGTVTDDNLAYTLTGPDAVGPVGALAYAPTENQHQVQINFVPSALSGHARVLGLHKDQFIDINADYRLQTATNISPTTLFANDGNLRFFFEANSLPVDTVHFLTASPWGLPGPLPSGLAIAGEAYELTASANITRLTKPAILTLRYNQAISETITNLAIYRWDFGAETWQPLGGDHNLAYQEVSTTTLDLGLYALLGTDTATRSGHQAASQAVWTNPCALPPENPPYLLYLPMIVQ